MKEVQLKLLNGCCAKLWLKAFREGCLSYTATALHFMLPKTGVIIYHSLTES